MLTNKFIKTPYLPKGKVTLAVCGFNAGIEKTISPPALDALPSPLRHHADLGLCPLGGNEVVCPPDSFDYYKTILSPYGFSVIRGNRSLGVSYPHDTAYNVVVVGNYAVLNPNVCDEVLLLELEKRYEILPVRQGYAKCSVAPVSENAAITADRGICRALREKGIDVLLISNDGVELPPYENGFFGGACGLVSQSVLAVNGSLREMKSGREIVKFLQKYTISPAELALTAPFDTGSLIPLMISGDNINETEVCV